MFMRLPMRGRVAANGLSCYSRRSVLAACGSTARHGTTTRSTANTSCAAPTL